MKKILFLIPLFLFAKIDNTWFNQGKEGWFFYQENNETNETNKTKQLPIYAKNMRDYVKRLMKLPDNEFMKYIPLNSLDQLTAEEFRKINKRAKEIAVMKPTRENVIIVKRLNKFMTDQADKYARVWYAVTLQNPQLQYPSIKTTPYQLTPDWYKKQKEIKDFYAKYKNKLGYVVFYDPRNKIIEKRLHFVYDDIAKQYGIYVKYIDVTKRPDLVAKFRIKSLPDNFFVYSKDDKNGIWVRFMTGLPTNTEVIKNTMFMFNNVVSPKDK